MPTRPARHPIVLASLLALTAIAAGALAGPATATHGPTDRGGEPWDPSGENASGAVGPGAVVFQGESGIETIAAGNGSAADFRHVENGTVLEVPIPTDQPTGTYEAESNGDRLVVEEPQITDWEFQTEYGADISGGTVGSRHEPLSVRATYNFGTATDLQVRILDEDGREWTAESVPQPADRVDGTTNASRWVTFPVELDQFDMGEYTVEISSRRSDVGGDDVTVRDTFEVSSGPHPLSVVLERESAGPDETVDFEIAHGIEDEHYLVTVADADLQGVDQPANVFAETDKTTEVGSTASYAYALIQIQGGVGEGAVRTRDVAEGNVTVQARELVSPDATVTDEFVENLAIDDERTVEVEPDETTDGSADAESTDTATEANESGESETTPEETETATGTEPAGSTASPGSSDSSGTKESTDQGAEAATPTADGAGSNATTTDGADGPAPGPVATVLAMLGAAGLHRRRQHRR